MISHFNELVDFLKKNKYTVKVTQEKYTDSKGRKHKYRFARVIGKNIRGGFATESDFVYPALNNRITANNIKCFDKWSKCPLTMKLPLDDDALLKHLEHLGSEEGFKLSNNFCFVYPRELD